MQLSLAAKKGGKMSVGEGFSTNSGEKESFGSTGVDVLTELPDFSEHMKMVAKEEQIKQLQKGAATISLYIEGSETMPYEKLKEIKGKPEAYTAERQAWHEEVLVRAAQDAYELSEKLDPPPRIIAMRGCCGAGKTTAVKEKYGDKGIIVGGDVPGAVKPDYFKEVIKQEARDNLGIEITSSQAHMESTGICRMHTERLLGEPDVSLLIDKQLEEKSDITEIIEWGKQSGKQVVLLDNDVPIELSAFRVLKRRIGGADPNIEFNGVAKGFVGIRANRGQMLDDIRDGIVSEFSLKAFDPVTKQQVEVIKKEDGEIVYIPGYEDLGRSVSGQDEESAIAEVNSARDQIITPEYVEEFVSKYFDESESAPDWSKDGAKEARRVLGAYAGLGITLGEALDSKAAGIDSDRNRETGELNDPRYREKVVAFVEEQRGKKDKNGEAA